MTLKGFLRRLGPKHLAGQITLLIFVTIIAFQAITLVTFHVLDVEGRRHIVDQDDFIASVVLGVDAAEPKSRQFFIDQIDRATPYANIHVVDERPLEIDSNDAVIRAEARRVESHLWDEARVFLTDDPNSRGDAAMSVALRKGGYALISISQHEKPLRTVWRWLWNTDPATPFWLTPWARSALLFLITTTILVFWASKGIVGPLVRLADRAENFSGEGGESLVEMDGGPREIRDLARAFNGMQTRIASMIAARAHVLAAVSHDLRTIITRLNLRTEFITDDALKAKMHQDIVLMDSMLHKNLQYLCAKEATDRSLIDIDSVIQTVVDEFRDLGFDVDYRGGERQMIIGSITEMHRVWTNLFENAVHHAQRIEVELRCSDNATLQIDVADDGPGISDDDKANVLEPFVRGQPGRSVDEHGGFGLGLSIVRSLVEAHGGTVELRDNVPRGLKVRITLPQAFPSQDGVKTPIGEA